MKKEGQKKIGNGFKFRITQFILYLLAFVGFLIGTVVWYLQFNYSKSFAKWLDYGYYYNSRGIDLDNDGDFSDAYIDSGYGDTKTSFEVSKGDFKGTYYFVSEDMSAKEIVFGSENGSTVTLKFNQLKAYEQFVSVGGWLDEFEIVTFYIFLGLAAFFGVFAMLQALATFLGKKSIKANNLGIVINSIMVGYGVFGLVGSVKGRMYLQFTKLYGDGAIPAGSAAQPAQPQYAQPQQPQAQSAATSTAGVTRYEQPASLNKAEEKSTGNSSILAGFPVDYENKPGISRVLDRNNSDNFLIENSDGVTVELEQLYVTVYGGNPYFVARTVNLSEEEGGGVLVFRINYDTDRYDLETDDAVCEAVFGEYKHAAQAQSAAAEPEYTEPIQPKMSAKARKGITIAAIASYALLFVFGILMAAVPSIGNIFSGIGICEKVSARAYGITVGVMWCALVPTLGYLFVTVAPVKLGVKGKILVAALTTVLLVVMNVIFFVIINSVKLELNVELLTEKSEKLLEAALLNDGKLSVKSYFEGDDSWFIPVSMVFASIAFIICHALMLVRINPSKIKTEKPVKTGDGFGATLKYLLSYVGVLLLKLAKGILKFKEKYPEVFILVITVLLTWLVYFVSFIFSIICIAVLICVIAMYFIGVISWAYTPSSGSGSSASSASPTDEYYKRDKYTYTDSRGYEQTVYSSDGKEFYDAGGRYVGKSGDGEKFKKED